MSRNFINFLSDLRRRNLGDRFRPGELGTFFLIEKRSLPPDVKLKNPPLGMS